MAENSDVTTDEIKRECIRLERQMKRTSPWNLQERWAIGRLLIQLRNPATHYLPKGQLRTMAATLSISTREASDRMRVADVYRTDAAFKKASYGRTWTDIVRSLPPTREARTGSTRPSKNYRRILLDASAHVIAENVWDEKGLAIVRKLYDYLSDSEPGA